MPGVFPHTEVGKPIFTNKQYLPVLLVGKVVTAGKDNVIKNLQTIIQYNTIKRQFLKKNNHQHLTKFETEKEKWKIEKVNDCCKLYIVS